MSKHTVKHYVDLYNRLKIPWDELSKNTDFELDKLFHPTQETVLTERLKHLYDFFPVMEKQLRRRGMTVARQFKEFKVLYPSTYAETSFYFYYNKWKKKVHPSMHIEHKVGDKMYVLLPGAGLPPA